jgi:hypothetical protein
MDAAEKYLPPPHWPEYREEYKEDKIFGVEHRREFATRVGTKPVRTGMGWNFHVSEAEREITRKRAIDLMDRLAREEWETQREDCR